VGVLGGHFALRDELVLRPRGLEIKVTLCANGESGGEGR